MSVIHRSLQIPCIGGEFLLYFYSFAVDIYNMINSEPGLYWKISWKFTCPLAMATILVISFVDLFLKYPTYKAWLPSGTSVKLPYPGWTIVLIMVLILSSILCIPVFALLVHYKIFDPKIIGAHVAGKNRRCETKDPTGPSDSMIPLTSKV